MKKLEHWIKWKTIGHKILNPSLVTTACELPRTLVRRSSHALWCDLWPRVNKLRNVYYIHVAPNFITMQYGTYLILFPCSFQRWVYITGLLPCTTSRPVFPRNQELNLKKVCLSILELKFSCISELRQAKLTRAELQKVLYLALDIGLLEENSVRDETFTGTKKTWLWHRGFLVARNISPPFLRNRKGILLWFLHFSLNEKRISVAL